MTATYPPPPAHMPKEAKAEWKRLVPILVDRGTFDAGVAGALEDLCANRAIMQACDRAIADEGYMVRTANGSKPHSAIGARNRAGQLAFQLQKRLGLLPDQDTPAPVASNDPYAALGID